MESIHVPRSTLQRIADWWKPLVSLVAIVAWLWVKIGAANGWIATRVDAKDVELALVQAGYSDVQASVHHASTLADDHAKQLAALWSHVVACEAELVVYRSYSKLAAQPERRALLIRQARTFFLAEYARRLAVVGSPATAAELALAAQWTPELH